MNLWPFHHKKKTNLAAQSQSLQGVQLQSAAPAIAIPIVYGQARVAGNLIHYKDLVGGTVENLLISLTHAVMVMGICEGPITDIIHVWYDRQSRTVAGAGGLTVFLGTLSQAAWGFLTTNFPSEAIPYELTAYVASSTWPLKEGGSLPNFNWEVRGFLQWNYPTILDSNPKDVLNDFLTDPNHGALFPSAQIASLTAFRDYCTAAGIFLSPVYTTQQSAAQHMQELLALANSAFVWSDGLLKVVPFGDTAITANGVTFTPNVTPLYNLIDDDFIAAADTDPVLVKRKPQADAYNHIQLQFENRAKDYNADIAEAKDQTSIELTGLRTAPVMNAPHIKDAQVARTVVQLALQRQVYVRNTYEFYLGFRYVLLEPMDLVTLTDASLGLNQTTVRLVQIEEQDDGTFLCTAEEWPFGVASAALYGTPSEVGYAPNVASSTNPPGIDVSFDTAGQAILNLTGDKKTVEHIYVVRTDRVPTLAETQAGTVVNLQTSSNIATGVVVAVGAAVYVGDITYNTWGDESALVTAVRRREMGATSTPATPVDAAQFAYNANGPANGKMWICWTWSAFTIYKSDGTTITVPASSALPAPPTPSLSQVAGGALGARTLFARIGYVKNNMIVRVGPEASLAVSAGNLLRVADPGAVAGYDTWVALVGSSSNGEFIQAGTNFGNNFTEPTVGFNSATTTPYDNTFMPTGVTAYALQVITQYFFYPWYEIALAIAVFGSPQPVKSGSSAQQQTLDGHIGIQIGGMPVTTPNAGVPGSGSGVGIGKFL
jgi:hypothetical protein